MKLSDNIKKFRQRKKLTQEELANILGVSAQAVSKWETSDTYPDGSLLLPLADALDISLDSLFGNEKIYTDDLYDRLRRTYDGLNNKEEINKTYELGIMLENAIFGCDDPNYFYGSESVINVDGGFTYVSGRDTKFFSVFPEPDDGWGELIGDGEHMRKIFECLADRETMNAVLFLHRREAGYYFEADVLAEPCGIAPENLEKVMDNLVFMRLVRKTEVDINGESRVLWISRPTYRIIAALIMAEEIRYNGGYNCQCEIRQSAYLK